MKERTLTGMTKSDAEQVAGDFRSEGAKVEINEQPDGTWTVKATWAEKPSNDS